MGIAALHPSYKKWTTAMAAKLFDLDRQGRHRHRRQRRHRPRHGARPGASRGLDRRRGPQRREESRRPRGARGDAAPRRSRSTADVRRRRMRCRDWSPRRRRIRSGRHPGQQCRHQHPQAAAGLHPWRSGHGSIDVNLTSAFLMSKAVYPRMKQAGGGKIINIGP